MKRKLVENYFFDLFSFNFPLSPVLVVVSSTAFLCGEHDKGSRTPSDAAMKRCVKDTLCYQSLDCIERT